MHNCRLAIALLISTFPLGSQAQSQDWRVVDCTGDGVTESKSTRSIVSHTSSVPFSAIFRFNDEKAEVVESANRTIPRSFVGGIDKAGNPSFMSSDAKWLLTFFKASGRFELRSFDLKAFGANVVTKDSAISGTCKKHEVSKVFD